MRDIIGPAGAPLRVVYDGMSDAEIQRAAFELLAPGGIFVGCTGGRNLTPEQHASQEKQVLFPYGSPFMEDRRELCLGFYKQMTALFESGELKV